MINEITLYVCDKCGTVGIGQVWQPCLECGKAMVSVKFVRVYEKDAPMILTDIPCPLSTDEMLTSTNGS